MDRASKPSTSPAVPAYDGGQARAAVVGAKTPASPPISAEECEQLPDQVLDHQAGALRVRLGRAVAYADRDRDQAELRNVEGELAKRQSARQSALRDAHGGVYVCKRTADLPGKDVHGAEHWWLETTRKSVGMGPATGNVPGHGESLPESFDTQLVDHSKEKATTCEPVSKIVDEDCIDRELTVGESTGTWIPLVNDCHTVVTRIIDKCHDEARERSLEAIDGLGPRGNDAVAARGR